MKISDAISRNFRSISAKVENLLNFKSLTMRIWVSFTFIILVVILGVSFFNVMIFRRIGLNEKKETLLALHNLILNDEDIFIRQDRLFRGLSGIRHYIYKDGFVKTMGRQSFSPEEVDTAFWLAAFAADSTNGRVYVKSHGNKAVIFTASPLESGYFVSYSSQENDNTLMRYMLATGAIFIFSGFFAAKAAASKLSEPLLRLEKFTEKIAAKDWGEPIEIWSRDEIGRLAQSMNKMQSELKRADYEEQNFLQSISHGLKTPVMVIMSHADAIIDGVYVKNLQNTAQIIKNEAAALDKKIRQLLYLNTLPYSLENESRSENLDLSELAENIVSRFKLSGRKLKWTLNAEPCIITADCEKMTTAIENIIENAMRYAASEIRITVSGGNMEIYNDGSSIAEEEADEIFKNMYKGRGGNFGLGLAISKKTIEFYNGSISAVNKDDGVSFSISFGKTDKRLFSAH